MIQDIESAGEAVGITTIITNSNERIETQLSRITGFEDLPIMLVSWDLETELTFNSHGFLNNPSTKVVCLLMDKAEDNSKLERESSANRMGALFQSFIQELYNRLTLVQQISQENILTGISYKLVPKHGAGKHSGIMGRFTMETAVSNCKAEEGNVICKDSKRVPGGGKI